MTIWLYGDSIWRGAALGRYPDLYTASEAAAEPLWPFRSPAEVMNLVLGRELVRHGGGTGMPDQAGRCAERLARRLGAGEIMAGDAIVMLDVGPHGCDPDAREAAWRTLRGAVDGHPVQLFICEGFDGGARGRPEMQHRRSFGGRTPNDATRAAAGDAFVALDKPIARFARALKERWGLPAYRRDGVHLNVLGQFRLCSVVLEAIAPGERAGLERLEAEARALWAPLGAPGPEAAAEMLHLAFRPAADLYLDRATHGGLSPG